jgi:hypothetical protein
MELQTLFEMDDIAVSALKYHVVSSVPDFQTKLADSRPARLALIVGLKMVVVKGGKIKNGCIERRGNSFNGSYLLHGQCQDSP